MNILKKIQPTSNAIHISEDGVEIPTSLSGSVPGSVPSPNFSQTEFLATQVVNQSQIDFSTISDMLQLIFLRRKAPITRIYPRTLEILPHMKK